MRLGSDLGALCGGRTPLAIIGRPRFLACNPRFLAKDENRRRKQKTGSESTLPARFLLPSAISSFARSRSPRSAAHALGEAGGKGFAASVRSPISLSLWLSLTLTFVDHSKPCAAVRFRRVRASMGKAASEAATASSLNAECPGHAGRGIPERGFCVFRRSPFAGRRRCRRIRTGPCLR